MAVGDDNTGGGGGSSTEKSLSFGDALYLHPNNTNGTPIITIKLTGTEITKYGIWS